MKISRRWPLVAFVLSLASSSVSLELLPYLSDETVTTRSEGGSQIEAGDIVAARERAVQNALRKAVRSQVGALVSLSRSESDGLMPDVEANLDTYVVEYEVNKERVQNDAIRVILDVQIMPGKLVEQILDKGFLRAFRRKPRILIALPDEQDALTTALERGFVETGFRVIEPSRRKRELSAALEAGNMDTVLGIGRELGSNVVITGECRSTSMDSGRLGSFRSWCVEASLKAVRCDDDQILAAGNFDGTVPGLSKLTGQRKAAEKLAKDVIQDLPSRIIEIWATDAATGKITIKPMPDGGPPPQITVNTPSDGEVTAESTVRLVGAVKDDQSVEEIRLFVNGASLALDEDLHLISEANKLLVNRLVPLKSGENTISVLAFDQDENRAAEEITVFFDPSKNEGRDKDSAPQILIYTPVDGEISDSTIIPVRGEIVTREPLSSVSIIVDGSELPIGFDRAASTRDQRLYRIHRLVSLPQKRNVIRITVQTISGVKSERYITVFAKSIQELTQPEIFIYEPEGPLTTAAAAVPLDAEILADAETVGLVVLNNGKEEIRRDELSSVYDSRPPYKVFELKESLELGEGENVIEIIVSLKQGGHATRRVTVDRTRHDRMPVRIEIASPVENQKLSNENLLVVGEVISSVPIQGQIDITVNGREPSLSKGMRLARPRPDAEDRDVTSFNREIGLVPGQNEIEVIVTTLAGNRFRKSVSVSYLPNIDFQIDQTVEAKRKHAVIVGVSKYQDPDITSLKFASVDAQSVYQFVTDPNGGGFPKDNVRLLVDEQATREAIMKTIGEWLPSRIKPDDMVLLFYSGHGGVEVDLAGEESDGHSKYLIPHDAILGSLFSTAILNSMVTTMLRRINSNQMIFLIDCCYSGGSTSGQEIIKSISPPSTKVETDVYRDFSGSGRVVISASLPSQLSFELPQLDHGLFTYNLLRGVSGEADSNRDGLVTLISEIYPFVIREVSSMARSYGFQQNPMLKCQVTGELVLSKVLEELD